MFDLISKTAVVPRSLLIDDVNPSEHPTKEKIVQTFVTIRISSLLRTLNEVCIGISEGSVQIHLRRHHLVRGSRRPPG